MRLVNKLDKIDTRFKTTLNRLRETMSTPPLGLNQSKNYSLILFCVLILIAKSAMSQDVLLDISTDGQMVQTCGGVFLDSGASAQTPGNYDIFEDYTITLCTESPGEKLNIDFEEFFLGNSGVSKMYLYDGDSEAADPITIFPKPRTDNYFEKNELTGVSFTAMSDSGCITIRFISGLDQASGWKANLSCCQDIDGDLVYDPAGFPENDIDDPLTDFVEVKKDNTVLFKAENLNFPKNANGVYYEWIFVDDHRIDNQVVLETITTTSPELRYAFDYYTFDDDGYFNNKLFLRIYDSFGCYHEEMIEFRVLTPKVDVYPAVTRNNLSNLEALLYGGNIPTENGVTKEILGLFPDDYHCLITQIKETSGSNSLQNASIGYFENSSDTFPYEQGIVLTSGYSKEVEGPQQDPPRNGIGQPTSGLGSRGTQSWTGDDDLTEITSGNTYNSSSVEFVFTAPSNEIKIDYLLASNEYGGEFECLYSITDSFGFFLTEQIEDQNNPGEFINKPGAIRYNLAVIPETATNWPVDATSNIPDNGLYVGPTTIKSAQYVNCFTHPNGTDLEPFQTYFGELYGAAKNSQLGTDSRTSAINRKGRTVPMEAKATVEPFKTYKLKLVVADGFDEYWDNAVFINKIDLGGDLGLDKRNSVIQVGDQDNDGKDDIAPALCPGEILTMQTSFEGTPHQWWFQTDPNDVSSRVVLESTNTIQDADRGEGLYGYEIDINGCVISDEILIEYFEPLEEITDEDLLPVVDFKCAGGDFIFTFEELFGPDVALYDNGIPIYNISYHNSQIDAENGSNALDDYDNTSPNFQYLSTNPNVSETIWVSIIPAVCDDPSNRQVRSFKLKSIEAIYPSDIPLCSSPLDLTKAFENKDVSAFTITYSDESGQIIDPTSYTNGAVDKIINVQLQSNDGCTLNESFKLNSSTLDIVCVSDQTVTSNNNGCSYIVSGAEFDVQNVTSCGSNFTYEYLINNQSSVQSNTLDGVELFDGDVIEWTVNDGVNQNTCVFTISVTSDDTILPSFDPLPNVIRNVNDCSYTIQGNEFDVLNLTDNCTDPNDITLFYSINSGANTIASTLDGVVVSDGDIITWNAADEKANIYSESFIITLNSSDSTVPSFDCLADLSPERDANFGGCSYLVQGTEFDISNLDDNCTNSNDLLVFYKINGGLEQAATTLDNVELKHQDEVTWIVRDTSNNEETCSFTLNLNSTDTELPTFDCPTNLTFNANENGGCNYKVLGTELDLLNLNDNCTAASNLIVTYKINNGTAEISDSLINQILNNGDVIEWLVEDAMGNFDTCEISIVVNTNDTISPLINSCISDQVLEINNSNCSYLINDSSFDLLDYIDNCTSFSDLALEYQINSNPRVNSKTLEGITLTDDTNVIKWFVKDNNGNEASCTFKIILEDTIAPNLVLNQDEIVLNNGTYTVTYDEIIDVTASSDFCDIDWSTVVLSKNTFSCEDSGTTQDIDISVSDFKGNEIQEVISVLIVGDSTCELYPKFFTPNGNGQNDTWQLNVLAESNQTGSYAVVYDRYGKEIITLTPSNNSWDGTYKGTPMPSNDYWFVLYYTYKSGNKVSKTGHFSLKR